MALLEVEGLVKSYGRRRVVNGVSFKVDPGEIVGLLGPNGAGKTTSFRMTIGMIRPERGRVRFAGHDVTDWPMYRRARLGMGYLSQESSVFRRLTVEQNILAILEAMPASRTLKRKLTRQERWERTDRVLHQFGLVKVRRCLAADLSGGEKRRLEIARCLVCEPLLILLDEPFTGIDPITIADIQSLVRQLQQEGIAILLTDHNVREALKITSRSYVITDGVVEAHGTPAEILRHPLVIRKYLGESFAQEALHLVG
ncbi:MAG: LPS export ABC transporter ATP-binding protein [Gemmataceae bacterium]